MHRIYNAMKTRRYFFAAILAFSLPFSAFAAPNIDIAVDPSRETITLTLPSISPHKVFTLETPNRLVVDVPSIPLSAAQQKTIRLPKAYNGVLIKDIRFGQFSRDVSRFVFDLQQPVRISRTVTTDNRKMQTAQLVIGIEPTKGAVATTAAEKKPVVVIDPGHGGVDPGAMTSDGMREKDIVLSYAKALREKLLKTGRYQVVLTRTNDSFIKLRQRIEIARKSGGDIFISLHADSAPGSVRGLSVYTLSEEASDEEAAALAARENKADVLAGINLADEHQDVADILISLAQRETNNLSATLATQLISSLGRKIKLLHKSHRFAGFAVLKAPDIPSVLVELGFLSHREDKKLLKSDLYRDKVLTGIVSGIDAYFRQKKKASDQ